MEEQPNFDFLRGQPQDSNPYPWSASEYVRRQERSDALDTRRTLTAVGLSLGLAGLIGALLFCYSADRTPVDLPTTQASQLELQAYD